MSCSVSLAWSGAAAAPQLWRSTSLRGTRRAPDSHRGWMTGTVEPAAGCVYSTPGRAAGWSLLEGYTLHRAAFSEQNSSCCLHRLAGACLGTPVRGRRGLLSKLSPPRSGQGTGLGFRGGAVPMGSAGADNAKLGPAWARGHGLSRRVLSFTYVGFSGQTTRRKGPPRPWSSRAGTSTSRDSAWSGRPTAPSAHPDAGAGAGPPFSAPSPRPSRPESRRRASASLSRLRSLPRPCLPGLRRIRRGLRHSAGRTAALWCRVSFPEDPWLLWLSASPFGLGWRYWNRSACRKTAGAAGGKNGGAPRKP